ncbi:hypothetical protein PHLCEN_2v10690 [Hermanssonia centrifuga]|uniref:COP9 signalosome complex subunit 4 n=1 Tax=Hermanssonia centrifuga TaxID=98765 RepID=A0A2R6NLX6_9APHY|nr:hypothetical protein PHLCEN_2v10690 [Hermanssonia centrifuga]
MENTLAQIAPLAQKDKGPAYVSVVHEVFRSDQPTVAVDIRLIVETVLQDNVVVGRQVLSELAKCLGEGAIKNAELRKETVQDTLTAVQPRLVSYEEQILLRVERNGVKQLECSWGSRSTPVNDEEKLRVYVRIVRLLLEEEDSVQAETYYNRAASLAHTTNDKELLLGFKLSQARIHDYSRRFLEAAMKYHELSWVAEIDEEERKQMLSAAVTCAVLAPAGPNRSRVLAALCRDERTSELPTFNILTKMFLDRILRSAEVHEFEGTLKPHQLAKIALSSSDQLASADDDVNDPSASKRTGPSTVLDRAVMEHNLLASSKIYNNITFRGLGALLDVTPGAAETMARRMIEQGRLKGTIDQVEKLIWFDVSGEEDEAQGKAGGLGDVEQVTEDTGAPFTKRWDMQIRKTAANRVEQVESIVQHLTEKGLVKFV